MSAAADTSPAPPPARADALADPLLDGALHLFALVTQQERIGHGEALRAMREQVAALAPDEAAARVTAYFDELLRTPQRAEDFCAGLREAAAYEDRVYLLLKVLEFRRRCASAAAPAATDLPADLLRQLDIRDPDVPALRAINNRETAVPPPAAGSQVRILPVTDSAQPGALWVPAPGVAALFVAVGRTFYVVRRGTPPVRLGRRELPAHVFRRIRDDETVTLGGKSVTPHDLGHYFRQASRPAREGDLFIRIAEHEIRVGHAPTPETSLRLSLNGVTPLLAETAPGAASSLEVNGHPVPAGALPVWLSDRVRYGRRRINLRKLLAYARHDNYVFAGPGDVCTVSNDPQSPIQVPDAAARHWESRLEATADGALLLHHGDCPHAVRVGGKVVRESARLAPGDAVQVDRTRLLVGRAADGALEVTARDDKFSTVEVAGVSHRFANGVSALDDIRFELQRGDLVCVLGPSGCGKSTLLNVLNGSLAPAVGDVRLDGASLSADPALQARIGFVPQDDLLHENLTVRENLLFAARLRWPQEGAASHRLRVDAALRAVDLVEQADARVGDALDKSLSGGQRKRVNIGLELVGAGSLLLLDEPTSGLSAGDTRKIVEVLRRRADAGNIVLVVAHQPSARVLGEFDKVLVLDRGGRLAFFGRVEGCYQYFGETLHGPGHESHASTHEPGMIFEALEQPRVRIDGSPDIGRRYPPAYWQARYRSLVARYAPVSWREEEESARPAPASTAERPSFLRRCATLLAREVLNKRRGRIGLAMQLLSALFLGFAAALACRVGVGGEYSYQKSAALLNYMFLTVIVCLFLAVSGSVQEIIRDRAVLLRERMLGVPFAAYLQSKFVALFLIYVCQLTLYLAVGFWLLQIPELFGLWWLFLTVLGCTGIGLGLAISAVPGLSERAAAVLVPLVIIPQIILSGADPFPFSAMRHLQIGAPAAGDRAPAVAQIMPSRWAFEGLVVLHRDHGFQQTWLHAKEELGSAENVIFRKLPSGTLRRSDPAAYEKKYAEFAELYQKKTGKPLTPERVALYRFVQGGGVDDPQDDPDIQPLGRRRAREFNENETVKNRFPRTHRIPGTTRTVDAAGFDAAVLLGFAAGFVALAGLLHAGPAAALAARRRRARVEQQTATPPVVPAR